MFSLSKDRLKTLGINFWSFTFKESLIHQDFSRAFQNSDS